jgi:hypothetical protein
MLIFWFCLWILVPFGDNANQSNPAFDPPPLAKPANLNIFGSARSAYA